MGFLKIFSRKPAVAAGEQKPRWWQFFKKRAARNAAVFEARREELHGQVNRIADLTEQRDKILDGLTSKLVIDKAREEKQWQFEHRVNQARQINFNNPQVLEAQEKINAEIAKYCKMAKIDFEPNAIRNSLGREFDVDNLGWSGRTHPRFGQNVYPDLGIKRRPQNV